MSDKPPPQPAQMPLVDCLAPTIFFDAAPNFGMNFGVVSVTLSVVKFRPDGGGRVASVPFVAADLRCSVEAAKNLRDALNGVILMAETPTAGAMN